MKTIQHLDHLDPQDCGDCLGLGDVCPYHRGFGDGWDALADYVGSHVVAERNGAPSCH